MTDSTTTNSKQQPRQQHNHDDIMNNIDPIEVISHQSKLQGRIAGSKSGYYEGYSIGITKGWEIGLELGYMLNFCSDILSTSGTQQQQDDEHEQAEQKKSTATITSKRRMNNNSNISNKSSSSSSRLDRCKSLANDIIRLIDEFPTPQHLFHDNHTTSAAMMYDQQTQQDQSIPTAKTTINGAATANTNTAAAALTQFDIASSIQRIRSKFKLLSVLLKSTSTSSMMAITGGQQQQQQQHSQKEQQQQQKLSFDLQKILELQKLR
jgi:hypothetical protein